MTKKNRTKHLIITKHDNILHNLVFTEAMLIGLLGLHPNNDITDLQLHINKKKLKYSEHRIIKLEKIHNKSITLKPESLSEFIDQLFDIYLTKYKPYYEQKIIEKLEKKNKGGEPAN